MEMEIEMELEKETMDLENKMVSVQGWSLVKFSQHFPMIYLANLNFALETMKTTVSPIPKPPKFYTAPETELSYACAVYPIAHVRSQFTMILGGGRGEVDLLRTWLESKTTGLSPECSGAKPNISRVDLIPFLSVDGQ